jgi:hypothetical protein
MVPVTRRAHHAARPRRGASLLELLVALPLTLLVGAVAVELFVTQWRVAQQTELRWRTRRELDHAALVLASELRPLAAEDLETWSDTSLVAQSVVLVGVVCGVPAPGVTDVVVVGSAAPISAAVFGEPRSGDRLTWPLGDSTLAGIPAHELAGPGGSAILRDARRVSGGCAASPLLGSGSPWRFVVEGAPESGLAPGAMVRVQRRVEWRAYRATDGAWYLGRRDWNGDAWNTIQPAVGPLHRGAGGVFTVSPQRADGTPATPVSHDVRQIAFTVRARRPDARRPDARLDSLRAVVALRGGW